MSSDERRTTRTDLGRCEERGGLGARCCGPPCEGGTRRARPTGPSANGSAGQVEAESAALALLALLGGGPPTAAYRLHCAWLQLIMQPCAPLFTLPPTPCLSPSLPSWPSWPLCTESSQSRTALGRACERATQAVHGAWLHQVPKPLHWPRWPSLAAVTGHCPAVFHNCCQFVSRCKPHPSTSKPDMQSSANRAALPRARALAFRGRCS